MEEILNTFRKLLTELTKCGDVSKREIICTPCGGNYGTVEAWVVAVNGSPARGTFFIGQNKYTGADDIFFIYNGRSRRVGSAQAKIVRDFEREFLSEERHPMLDKVFVKSIQ